MGFTLRNILDPSQNPLVPKPLQKLYGKTIGGKLQHMTDDYVAPQWKDTSKQSYINPFTGEEVRYKKGGKVKKFSKGGSMDDLAPRENLPDKNAAEQAREAKRKKPKQEDDLAPRENLPPKKYAKGGTVRGDGCCVKGKSKGRFR